MIVGCRDDYFVGDGKWRFGFEFKIVGICFDELEMVL